MHVDAYKNKIVGAMVLSLPPTLLHDVQRKVHSKAGHRLYISNRAIVKVIYFIYRLQVCRYKRLTVNIQLHKSTNN